MNTSNTLPMTIGLTGGIGSGKSLVSQIFAELGVPVIDTDQLSRELVQQGSPLLEEITKYFGKKILLKSGNLDRKKLRQIIFKSPEKKQWLEQLLHPQIKQLLLQQLSDYSDKYVVIVVPLLLESNNYNFINRILVIDCSEELQLKRAIERDQSNTDEIEQIIASQIARSKRLSLADDIIVNEGTLESLRDKITELHEKYQQLQIK